MKKSAFQLSDVPGNFPLCLNESCPQAKKCLHYMVRKMVPSNQLVLHVFNPEAVKGGEDCEHFRSLEAERYAYGFEGMQSNMLPKQYAAFKELLVARFSRNRFFVRRRGEFPISPKEQEYIRKVLQQIGADPEMDFDRYEERINWTD